MNGVLRGLVVSDFHTGNLVNLFRNDADEPAVELVSGSFGQVTPTLLDPPAPEGGEAWDFALVWTRPEAVIPGFAEAWQLESVAGEALLEAVDDYVDQLERFSRRVTVVFVPLWTASPLDRGAGALDLAQEWTPGRMLRKVNERLLSRLEGSESIFALDAARWVAGVGAGAFDPRLWYMAKIPFSPQVLRMAVEDVKAGLRAVRGRARKLLIVDLDDTMWGGIVGETGWEGLRLGGHDPVGEAFVDFQRALKALTNRGVILGIVSKNDEEVALRALREHPEMVLRPGDFAGWRINWQDKAQNVLELVDELNLGLNSAVFIDDNPAERGRVREALPEVAVPEWPDDPLHYAREIRSSTYFDMLRVSPEDRGRTESYVAERERRRLKNDVGSMEEWLRTLELKVEARPLDSASLPRAVQLLNKTNQMNLRTRRLTEAEFAAWARKPGRGVWTFRVRDRFSDAGLTGLLSYEVRGSEAWIEDFILSCRVFGRGIEETMIHVLSEEAARRDASELVAAYSPTERNQPCLEFFQDRSGFQPQSPEGEEFRWGLQRPCSLPAHVELFRTEA